MKLLHGDCLELMQDIPDGSVDMILCDLPYGTTACKWDSVIPFAPLWEQYRGAAVYNQADPEQYAGLPVLLVLAQVQRYRRNLRQGAADALHRRYCGILSP